ncbi:MAG: hypothetical protein J5585_09095 [Clostridia bacterium]|nr:hypothetical protein [Clostridia bacterium]
MSDVNENPAQDIEKNDDPVQGASENADPAENNRPEIERLKTALRDIREHMKQIDEILESVDDLLGENGTSPDAPASQEEIIDLLKKYSRL